MKPPRSTSLSPPVSQPITPLLRVCGFQLKPMSRWKLFVVSSGNRTSRRSADRYRGREDGLIEIDEILDRLARTLITHSECQGEVWPDSPLVLAEEKEIVPIVVKHYRGSRQIFVDVRAGRKILHEEVERSIFE